MLAQCYEYLFHLLLLSLISHVMYTTYSVTQQITNSPTSSDVFLAVRSLLPCLLDAAALLSHSHIL